MIIKLKQRTPLKEWSSLKGGHKKSTCKKRTEKSLVLKTEALEHESRFKLQNQYTTCMYVTGTIIEQILELVVQIALEIPNKQNWNMFWMGKSHKTNN